MRHIKFEEKNRPKLTKIIIVNKFEKYSNWHLQPSFGFKTYYNNKIHTPNSIGLLYHVNRAESKRGHVKSV